MSKGRAAVMACFTGVAVGVGTLVPRLPSPSYGVLAMLAASAITLSTVLARLGRTLDPAFVVIAATLLAVPWGLANLYGVIPPAAAIVGLTPFVVAALWIRPRARQQTLLLVPLLLLGLLAAISLAWSLDPDYGREKLTLWLFTGLMPAAFVLVLTASSMRVSWALILAVSVLTSIYFLLMAEPTGEYGHQPTVFGWNPIWSARVAAVGALIALFGPFPKWVRILALPVFLAHAWATGSLGPPVGLALGVVAGLVETLRLRQPGDGRVSVGLLGIFIVLGSVVLVFMTGLLEPVLAPVTDDPNVIGRTGLLAAALSLFISSPVVGTGLGGFTATGLHLYPHNLLVEIGAELGILGLLAVLAWWLLALRGAIGSPLLVALLIGVSVASLFSGSLASNEAFWTISGLAVAMVPIGRRQQAQRRNNLVMSMGLTRPAR